MANKNNHLIAAYQSLRLQTESCVLATVIETFGSTYRKAGARMLINQAGEMSGLLGGGCFERDLQEQAKSVFETGQAKTLFYDMRAPDDVVWGLGLGCNGAVRVFLQLLRSADDFNPLHWIADSVALQQAGVLVTVFASTHADFPVGHSLFVPTASTGNQSMLSTAPFPFATTALQTLLQQKPRIATHVIDGSEIAVFYDPVQPPWRLLVCGAGIDAVPLVACAKALGWQVTVMDHRPAYIQPSRFPMADHLVQLFPEEVATKLDLDQFSALILMTHNIEYDQRYLQIMVNSRIPFIGLLGPEPRKLRLLEGLGEDAELISDRVYGPVGLDIGAETPEEIALSIMAAVQAKLNGRNGQLLSAKLEVAMHEYSR